MPKTPPAFHESKFQGLGESQGDLYDGPAAPFQYETATYTADLELLDRGGRVALFRRRERVRFLDDGVGTFIDRVWGEGVLLAGYYAQSMRILDLIRTSKGYAVLLALPRRFRRGETFDVMTERRIVGAFLNSHEYWELSMPAPTKSFSLRVRVPRRRRCTPLQIVAPASGEIALNEKVDALRLSVREPAVHVPYRLEWSW